MKLFGVSCCVFALLLPSLPASAQVPVVVNYQGRIQVQGTNFTGNGLFKFAIGTENMDTVFWSNDGTVAGEPAAAIQANLDKGLYSIGLGNTALAGMNALDPDILANTGLWLRIWFSDGVTGFEPLNPDQPLASVPYALRAGTVERLGGFSVTNLDDVTDAGSGQIITGAERGQITTNASNISTMNARLVQAEINVAAVGSAVAGKVSKTGDTMTGPLLINNQATGGGIFIGSTGTTIAVGTDANGSSYGLAVGRYANGAGYGTVQGYYADGSLIGAAMGYATKADGYGAAVGAFANGTAYGSALGYNANAAFGGLALGASAHALNEGIALGQSAAADGTERIVIGNRITNEIDHSAAVRGTLYLDGGTAVYYRATAGSGEWMDMRNGMATGTPLYAFSETDPVWAAEKAAYATGTPLYTFTELDPVWAVEKTGYATGTPLYVYSETDPAWTAEKANYATGTPLYAYAESDPFSVKISGDTMTGALNINAAAAGGDLVIGTTGTAVSIGRSANGTGNGAAVGRNANGAGYGAGVGFYADGSDNGAAVGYSAKGGWYGAAIGPLANGSIYGSSVGRSANGFGGSAVGFGANGAVFGTALGQDSKANHGGVAIGYLANGSSTNIAIGMAASAVGQNRIAIGANTTNTLDNSAAIRGSLYLDGGTAVYYRATAGSGAWSDIRSGMATGTPLYAYSETDPVYVSEKPGLATGTPVYVETDPVYTSERSGLATGSPVYVESDPVWTAEKAGYATGTPLYAFTEADPSAVLADGSRAMTGNLDMGGNSITNVATNSIVFADGTTLSASSVQDWNTPFSWGDHSSETYATGTPVYAESDPTWVSEKSGYATGTPVYTESDPLWGAEKAGYATGTPLYAYSETDPVYASEKAGLATGTPVYVESDPVWTSEKSAYATGTPLYVETDALWSAASNSIQAQISSNDADIADNLSFIANNEFEIINIQSQVSSIKTSKVSKTGDTMSGALNLPVNGLLVGTTQLVLQAGRVGINQPNPATSLHVGRGRALDTDPVNGGIITIGSIETLEDFGGVKIACDADFLPKFDDCYYLGDATYSWYEVNAYNYVTWSDGRLKKGIADIDYGLDDIMKLRPVSYMWKDRLDQNRSLGLIAQEVEPIISEVVVTHMRKRLDENKKGKFERVPRSRIGINYMKLIPVLIRGIQELKTDQDAIRREIVPVEGGSLELRTTEMRVPFTSSFTNSLPQGKLPIVTVTPCSPEASIYIAEISASGFTVRSNVPITDEVMFTWIAIVPSGQNQRLQ